MNNDTKIKIAHGNGGTQMQELLSQVIFPGLDNQTLNAQEDGAVLSSPQGYKTVFTTDAFTVQPIFFPGGDIGHLSVCGTVNDLAMMGAEPAALSLAMIIEAGFEIDALKKIVESIRLTAAEANVSIVTGDTKVVDQGQADKIFITTSGVGWCKPDLKLGMQYVSQDDTIIVSGTIGHHGMSILSARAALPIAELPKSDAAPLNNVVKDLLEKVTQVKWLRDPTRGGVAAALNELAQGIGHDIEISSQDIPVAEDVRGLAELLGVDPLYLANEGRFVMVCPSEKSAKVLEILHSHEVSQTACVIGQVKASNSAAKVIMKLPYGSSRIIEMPSGEQLPRIC